MVVYFVWNQPKIWMTYLEKLKLAVTSSNSTLCVGLDPNLRLLPDQIKNKIAKDAGIFLLRIGYDENVEDILEKTFLSY